MRKFFLVTALAVLSACAGRPPLGGSPQVEVVQAPAMPEPTRDDLAPGTAGYNVSPLDELLVDVFGIEALTGREIRVDAAGYMSFPLAGSLLAAGKSTQEIAQIIRSRLMTAGVRNPDVTVNLKDPSGQLIAVDGQVNEPGLYPVTNQMSLMRSIASAKGVTQFSKLDDVVVFRTVDGQRYAALYNLAAIRRGAYPDPAIFANDIIVVGDSPGRRLFAQFLSISSLAVTPIIVALQGS